MLLKKTPFTKLIGIVNITKDSFSDGGQYLDSELAVKKAKEHIDQGAAYVDIGAESSHPDSETITFQQEIDRLTPVVSQLKKHNIPVSIDTYRPEVMAEVLKLGVDMINDITALKDPECIDIIKQYDVPVVIMYARNLKAHAQRTTWESQNYIEEIILFFDKIINILIQKSLNENHIIIYPRIGFFIGSNPEPSLSVLKNLNKLKTLNKKIYISTSKKSFIGTLLNKPVSERDAGTLATEIWAVLQGVDFIRTHNVKNLNNALTMIRAIQSA